MSFDFFNTSLLAFGSKLTAAFTTLTNNAKYAIENVDKALSELEYYQQYINKNYRVPVPTRSTMAVRVNEIYSVIDESVDIKELKYENNTFSVEVTYFNNSTNKITNAVGETSTLKEGYAYVVPSTTNTRMTKEIRFSSSDDKKGNEILLFKFRVDNEGKIFLGGDLRTTLKLFPQDATQYTSLSGGETITFPYTAQDYECICVIGYIDNILVNVNDTTIIKGGGGGGYHNRNHAIIYLKKGDVVSGTIETGFKINYNY